MLKQGVKDEILVLLDQDIIQKSDHCHYYGARVTLGCVLIKKLELIHAINSVPDAIIRQDSSRSRRSQNIIKD